MVFVIGLGRLSGPSDRHIKRGMKPQNAPKGDAS